MNIRRKRSSIGAVISLASMADIAFLLLIFFVVTSSIGKSEADSIQIPEAESPPITESSVEFSLSVDAAARIFYRGSEITLEGLPGILAEAAEQGDFPGRVQLIAEQNLPYSSIAPLIQALTRAGVRQLIFLARLKPEAP